MHTNSNNNYYKVYTVLMKCTNTIIITKQHKINNRVPYNRVWSYVVACECVSMAASMSATCVKSWESWLESTSNLTTSSACRGLGCQTISTWLRL